LRGVTALALALPRPAAFLSANQATPVRGAGGPLVRRQAPRGSMRPTWYLHMNSTDATEIARENSH